MKLSLVKSILNFRQQIRSSLVPARNLGLDLVQNPRAPTLLLEPAQLRR